MKSSQVASFQDSNTNQLHLDIGSWYFRTTDFTSCSAVETFVQHCATLSIFMVQFSYRGSRNNAIH